MSNVYTGCFHPPQTLAPHNPAALLARVFVLSVLFLAADQRTDHSVRVASSNCTPSGSDGQKKIPAAESRTSFSKTEEWHPRRLLYARVENMDLTSSAVVR